MPEATRLHADEVPVDDRLVRGLVDGQFPQWASLPLRRLATTGTDNAIYRLGDDLAVRLPRIHWAEHQVDLEHEWLPRLAPHLPVPVPEPVAVGAAADGYPYRWLVYRWLDGDDALALGPSLGDDGWTALAVAVAGFVGALQGVDPTGAPPAQHRSGPLAPADPTVRPVVEHLASVGELDGNRAVAVWEAGLAAAPWPGPPVWTHGDLLPGNLLVGDGRAGDGRSGGAGLAGVIDWSATCVGDPACDAMLAWALPPAARVAFRSALGVDDDTWARARAWALQQAALFIPYYETTIPDGVAAARRRLAAVLADDQS